MTNTTVLIGYTLIPFMVKLTNTNFPDLLNVNMLRSNLQLQSSIQIEGITATSPNSYYLTAEDHITGQASLYRLNIEGLSVENNFDKTDRLVYPNPSNGYLKWQPQQSYLLEVYNISGQRLMYTDKPEVSLSHLADGIYVIRLTDAKYQTYYQTKIILQK